MHVLPLLHVGADRGMATTDLIARCSRAPSHVQDQTSDVVLPVPPDNDPSSHPLFAFLGARSTRLIMTQEERIAMSR